MRLMAPSTAFASIERRTGSCANCDLQATCLRPGLSREDGEHLGHLFYTRRGVKHGEDLYRAGDSYSAIYAIRSGFFKTEFVLRDGHSQVMGFYIPGEVMGMDGIGTGAYTCNAVALEDAKVCAIPLFRSDMTPNEMRDLAHCVIQIMSKELVHDHHVMAVLGGKSADARLAAFLVDLSRRFAARGYVSSDLELPMTREDIGSFLGLTLETISRMLSKLQRMKVIEVHRRHIRILHMAGLGQLL